MLGIVLIDYYSQERTSRYINDVLIASDMPINSIVVVDNSPQINNFNNLIDSLILIGFRLDETISFEKDKRIDMQVIGYINETKIFLLHSTENLGYAKANNLGFNILRQLCCIKYVLFSNSDILFINNKISLKLLVNKLKSNEDSFLIGPKVIYPNGQIQSPCRYISLYRRWWRSSLLWPIRIKQNKNNGELICDAPEGPVYRVIGAFMLGDADKFEEIGGFDEETFLYAEELILSEKAKKFGYKVIYTPDVEIIHENGYTVQKERTNKSRDNKLKMMLKSDLYYYQHYLKVNRFFIFLTKGVASLYFVKLHIKDFIFWLFRGTK